MREDETYPWCHDAPRDGSDEDLRALRALLTGYGEAAASRGPNIPNILLYSEPFAEKLRATPIGATLDALVRLFYDGLYAGENNLPADDLALLDRLGLVARNSACAGLVYATVAILPVAGDLTVCDRAPAPDGSICPLLPDVVYPAILETTRLFLSSLPSTSCEAMLEIGTGTGIGAIVSARHARRVWATDIAARSVHFARLSCRLAGLDNVTVVEGDLYQPVKGLTFDRIAIHPPWVPAKQPKFVFADGGEDGESVVRGAIEGLPHFLRPGGRFYCTVRVSDRTEEPFEQRVRRWLGADGEKFDIAFAEYNRKSPQEFLAENLGKSIGAADVRFCMDLWKATRTEALVYGSLIVRRHAAGREAITARAQAGDDYNGHHLEGLLDWEVLVKGPRAVGELLASRPAVSPQCVLQTTSRVQEGKFATEALALECVGPFRSLLACEWWLPQVLCRCDGSKTWRENFEWARSGALIPETVTAEQFAGLLAFLVRIGMLTRQTAAPLPSRDRNPAANPAV